MDRLLRTAWQPITPRGVAAFAGASVRRLLWVQFIVAVLVVLTVVCFLYLGCWPTIREAIRNLPDEGEIRSRSLDWRGDSPRLLAAGRFLALTVDVDCTGDLRSPAHVQIEFRGDNIKFRSLFGYLEAPYPDGWIVALNRTELQPWWGAWQPWLLVIAAVAVVLSLMLNWLALATLYTLPGWLAAFYANRKLSLWASWRLAGASLMPGALLMAVAIVFYTIGILDLLHLILALGLHVLLGWVYLVVSPWFLPRESSDAVQRQNPFARLPGNQA